MYLHVSDCISCCSAVAALLQRCCSAVAALLHQCCTAVAALLHRCEWHTKMLQPHLSSMRKITFQLIFPKKIFGCAKHLLRDDDRLGFLQGGGAWMALFGIWSESRCREPGAAARVASPVVNPQLGTRHMSFAFHPRNPVPCCSCNPADAAAARPRPGSKLVRHGCDCAAAWRVLCRPDARACPPALPASRLESPPRLARAGLCFRPTRSGPCHRDRRRSGTLPLVMHFTAGHAFDRRSNT